MATEKQIEWLSKLAKWKGQDINVEDIRRLDNAALDKMFAALKDIKVSKKPTAEKSVVIKQSEYNGARFGLACKLVLSQVDWDFISHNRDIYIKRIMQYYDIMTEAETAQHNLVTVGEVDADLLQGERLDRAAIADGLM